jgi:hypothetical protein
MMVVAFALLVVALVLFTLAAGGVKSPRVNLVAAGLACWVLAVLLSELLRRGLP